MCFAPQRRALFRHLNFQKWSDAEVFCTFWLRNVLRATTACIHLNFQKWSDAKVFCTFWLRNVLRATTACNFSSLIWPAGSAPAALASLLFDPLEPQIIEHNVWRLSYLFAHLRLLSSDSFSSLIFSLLLSSSLCLCPALLFICPYCRKFWLLNFLRIGLCRFCIDCIDPCPTLLLSGRPCLCFRGFAWSLVRLRLQCGQHSEIAATDAEKKQETRKLPVTRSQLWNLYTLKSSDFCIFLQVVSFFNFDWSHRYLGAEVLVACMGPRLRAEDARCSGKQLFSVLPNCTLIIFKPLNLVLDLRV